MRLLTIGGGEISFSFVGYFDFPLRQGSWLLKVLID